MLKSQLLHPQITAALARAGHTSKVLISDGNFPHSTRRGANCEVVYLNLAPGVVTVPHVLRVMVDVIPNELAEVMAPMRSGPYALKDDPEIYAEFRKLLKD